MKRAVMLTAAGILGLGASLMATDSAFAINRAQCGYFFMAVESDHTTCWANAGTAYVTLYNARRDWGGNNRGYTVGVDNNTKAIVTEYFEMYTGTDFAPETVLQIIIY